MTAARLSASARTHSPTRKVRTSVSDIQMDKALPNAIRHVLVDPKLDDLASAIIVCGQAMSQKM